jgi:hypothetical protein
VPNLTSSLSAGPLTPTKATKSVPAISQFAAPRHFLVQIPLIFLTTTGFKTWDTKVRLLARQGRIFLASTAFSADTVDSAYGTGVGKLHVVPRLHMHCASHPKLSPLLKSLIRFSSHIAHSSEEHHKMI